MIAPSPLRPRRRSRQVFPAREAGPTDEELLIDAEREEHDVRFAVQDHPQHGGRSQVSKLKLPSHEASTTLTARPLSWPRPPAHAFRTNRPAA